MSHVLVVVVLLGLLWIPAARADQPPGSAVGASVFAAHCANCHGAVGQSDTPVARAMKVPVIAGHSPSAAELETVIRANAKHASISKKVSDADIAALAGFLAKLGGS